MFNLFIKVFLIILLIIPKFSLTITGPLTKDFQNFLKEFGYDEFNFPRLDLGNTGSYGGKQDPQSKIEKIPIIFIHGNSDSALSIGTAFQTGWSSSIKYFLSKNYTSSELYATTWGDRDTLNASLRTHNCETITRIRRFIEAVRIYTQKSKVNIIAHSMGVTLGRGAIVGVDDCSYKSTISPMINTFIGISGANYGLCSCSGVYSYYFPTCNQINGFWPGDFDGSCMSCTTYPTPNNCSVDGIIYSQYLETLNTVKPLPASNVYSIWSVDDDIIKNNDYVRGQSTSYIPKSEFKIFDKLSHIESKDNTTSLQYKIITDNQLN
uniref:Lipase n=1 Tax=Strongyloides venezuelensis TaxID=75913 RepID=A0A0K0FW21_STRVS